MTVSVDWKFAAVVLLKQMRTLTLFVTSLRTKRSITGRATV